MGILISISEEQIRYIIKSAVKEALKEYLETSKPNKDVPFITMSEASELLGSYLGLLRLINDGTLSIHFIKDSAMLKRSDVVANIPVLNK